MPEAVNAVVEVMLVPARALIVCVAGVSVGGAVIVSRIAAFA